MPANVRTTFFLNRGQERRITAWALDHGPRCGDSSTDAGDGPVIERLAYTFTPVIKGGELKRVAVSVQCTCGEHINL